MVYKNSFDCIWKTYNHEGLSGIQKGLGAALAREVVKGGLKLGLYEPILSMLSTDEENTNRSAPIYTRMTAGAISGVIGTIFCNPFELVKTRMQANAGKQLAIGEQHVYTGLWNALSTVLAKEGFRSLFKGLEHSVVRSVVGSSLNLSTYTMTRDHLILSGVVNDGVLAYVIASLSAAFVSAVAMNPFDVVRTRVYNHPNDQVGMLKGLYNLVRTEGARALFKGLTSSLLRTGAHATYVPKAFLVTNLQHYLCII